MKGGKALEGDSMKDIEIIDLYFKRDEEAIRATEEKYGRLCHHIAFNILGSFGDAEECTNDTYLSLWNAIPPKRPDNFRAFVARIARNLSLKRLEYLSAKKRAQHTVIPLSELEEFLPYEHFDSELEDESLGEMLSSFLHGEREEARRVFVRRYFFCEDIKTIAKSYSFSEAKVKSLLHQTRQRLKKNLTEKGVYL